MTNAKRSPITTHILDISKGKPAYKVKVVLERSLGLGKWEILKSSQTNADGRIDDLLAPGTELQASNYRLSFFVQDYFQIHNETCFYPEVQISFSVQDIQTHYHVPLLISPFGYSTYRGS